MSGEPERYTPMPGVLGIPAFLWRKLGRWGRAAVVALGLGLVVTAVVLAPRITRTKEANARRDERDFRRAVLRQRRMVVRDQRLHRARAKAGTSLRVGLQDAITADARARRRVRQLPPPAVKATRCHPAREVPSAFARARRHGGTMMRCIAYTTLRRDEGREFGVGFEFLGVVIPAGRQLRWCKTNPLPAEKFNGASIVDVPLARACTDPAAR